ncbi:MAG: single-stranded DNA-binding protein [Parachlamydiales bacterium]|nr:single-stranded DNA-binding protein [Parachlamydiales bacterium]
MNFIQIAGNMGADAETRFTPNGQKVTTLRIATNSKKGGRDETIWWKVTMWGDRFDKLLPYLKKGTSLVVVGELSKPEIYVDKEGNSQVTLNITAEIIRFSPFGRTDRQENGGAQSQTQTNEDSPFAYSGGQKGGSSFGGSIQQGSGMAQSVSEDNVPF